VIDKGASAVETRYARTDNGDPRSLAEARAQILNQFDIPIVHGVFAAF
jgi:hypothetical protein